MQKTNMALLHCAKCDYKKLETYFGEIKSPEEALRWELRLGVAKCVNMLLSSEIYHWHKHDRRGKKPPGKLRKILTGLMHSSSSAKTEIEHIAKLREGIEKAVVYLRNIKKDETYLSSTTLQNVHVCLKDLLELKI